jgi:hypothetical protein
MTLVGEIHAKYREIKENRKEKYWMPVLCRLEGGRITNVRGGRVWLRNVVRQKVV